MMPKRTASGERGNPYAYGLVALGAGLAAFSWYLMQSTPMTALGIGIAVVGSSMAITPVNPVPTRAVRMALEGSMLNIEALLEDTGATQRCYYVRGGDGAVRAYVPLGEDRGAPGQTQGGLVVNHGGSDYLVVFPPGSLLAAGEDLPESLEAAMDLLLVEEAGLAESLKVAEDGPRLVVEFVRPRTRTGSGRVRQVLGSLESSTAAAVAAAVKGVPVKVASEEDIGRERRRVVLELLQ